jgi:hypothetical protein
MLVADSMALPFVYLFMGWHSVLCESDCPPSHSSVLMWDSIRPDELDAIRDIWEDNLLGDHPTSDCALLAEHSFLPKWC